MAKHTEHDAGSLEKLIRFLKERPRYNNHYRCQGEVDKIVVWTDSDFAGCKKARKTTLGGMIVTGSQVLELRTNNQAAIALSSGEVEYCSTVRILQHGERAEQAMGLKGVAD